ncbi:MAG TPA: helix-turn-helix domain-containing protein [Polyangiaceae bacterium]|nr:helix-turn-helix domain-containing protein [Polyangiaceae bacterium]
MAHTRTGIHPTDLDFLAHELPAALSPDEVSELTGLDKRTLSNRRSLGKPPRAFHAGGKVRYTRAAVLDFLRGAQQVAAAE